MDCDVKTCQSTEADWFVTRPTTPSFRMLCEEHYNEIHALISAVEAWKAENL